MISLLSVNKTTEFNFANKKVIPYNYQVRPNKKISVSRVLGPKVLGMLGTYIFFGKNRILCILKGISPFNEHKKNYHMSGSEITPCNKIDIPLVVYRLTGNVMTSITTLRT